MPSHRSPNTARGPRVEEIEARHPTEEEAGFLRLTDTQHVLEVVRIAYAANNVAAETVTNVFPSQQWRLSYEWTAS
ncbi:UTRA domain-containing protein [Streptosporangium sp. NPDC051022]|uniref:UTRA domain-containing protein n=1 Tax=Streptosporangium sp. NPDC051022 TaxID=3155752 RepID=UPI00343C1F69